MNVLMIRSATRPDSVGEKVASFFTSFIEKIDSKVKITLVSPLDFSFDYDSDSDKRYSDLLRMSDKLIIVLSEYNHGYPGRLKTLLDSEFDLYSGKEVFLIGVSSGPIGGARGVSNILPVLRALNLKIFRKDILIPFAEDKFVSKSEFNDQKFLENSQKLLSEFLGE